MEQIQPQKDNKEGKDDIDMKDDITTEKDDESNLMVKLKIDGQGVYLKKADYQTYQERMKVCISENNPN
jgi:hypothetical protein